MVHCKDGTPTTGQARTLCKAISAHPTTQSSACIPSQTSHFLVTLILPHPGAGVKRKSKAVANTYLSYLQFLFSYLSPDLLPPLNILFFTQNSHSKSKKIGRDIRERLGVLPDPRRCTVRLAKEIPPHAPPPSHVSSHRATVLWKLHIPLVSEPLYARAAQPSELTRCGN